jgi:secreted PhoX family phosphatase
VTDGANRRIRKISPDGRVTTVAGSGKYGDLDGDAYTASFTYVSGIAVDKAGNLFVADVDNNKIRKITPAGDVSTFAGSGGMDVVDGQGKAASFSYPIGICIDGAGNLFVADSAGDRIRKITPGGMVSTLAGSGIFGGKADGPAGTASFDQPIGIAVDNAGFVYVSELTNKLVRKISPGGQVSTLAGGGLLNFADGTGNAASFAAPKGIAVDNRGNLFVADSNRIRKLAPVSPGQ